MLLINRYKSNAASILFVVFLLEIFDHGGFFFNQFLLIQKHLLLLVQPETGFLHLASQLLNITVQTRKLTASYPPICPQLNHQTLKEQTYLSKSWINLMVGPLTAL